MKSRPCIRSITLTLAVAVAGWNLNVGAGDDNSDVNPTGTWKWVAPANPDGRIPEITFTLKLQGETLMGTVNKSTSTTAITNGVFKGDTISFQTIREGKAGKKTTTYSGKLSGDTIKGNMETDVDKTKFHNNSEWEARRVKE